MSTAPGTAALRLVGARVTPPFPGSNQQGSPDLTAFAPHLRVARENHAAAQLTADDARWILAQQTASLLEGGTAAQLRPERRRRVHDLATRVGLRPFDANLVIAIVQDAARTDRDALSAAAKSRLALVGEARRPSGSAPMLAPLAAAVGLGIAGAAVLVRWVLTAGG